MATAGGSKRIVNLGSIKIAPYATIATRHVAQNIIAVCMMVMVLERMECCCRCLVNDACMVCDLDDDCMMCAIIHVDDAGPTVNDL